MTEEFRTTPLEEIPQIRDTLREGFRSGKTKSLDFRRDQLIQLGYLVQDNAQRFRDALASDLGRPALEADFLEVNAILSEVKETLDSLKSWTKPEKPPFSFTWFAMRPTIRKEPKGVVLIISPFNFPIMLLLGPLCGALAAGNTVLLKPSELSPAFSALVAKLVPLYLDPHVVRVVNGAIPETTKLLEFHWDHILYTGSGRVGRIVSAAAAKHLSPVSTELGGKCPVFIDPKSDLKLAARRVLWGKALNAGQACVAPDYVLIPGEVQDQFIKELKEVYAQFYPTSIDTSPDFSRVVSTQHTQRIKKLLDNTQGQIVFGGETDIDKKYIALSVVKDVQPGDSLLSEEIFGPVLPIVPVRDVDEAIAYVNDHDHPLALYVFSQDNDFKAKVFDNTQSGACVANEVFIHVGAPGLPFGGIGPSGSGHSTGKYNFDMFTHLRSSLDNPGWVDKLVLGSRFPPYTSEKRNFFAKLQKVSLPSRPSERKTTKWRLWSVLALIGIVSSLLIKYGKVSGLIKS